MYTSIGQQCCDQLTVVKTESPLTSITRPSRGLRCRPIEVKYFSLKLSPDKLLVFKWSRAQVWFVFKLIWNMLCLCAAQLKCWLQTDLGHKNSASYNRQDSCFWLCSPWSRVGHALHPIFMLCTSHADWLFTIIIVTWTYEDLFRLVTNALKKALVF